MSEEAASFAYFVSGTGDVCPCRVYKGTVRQTIAYMIGSWQGRGKWQPSRSLLLPASRGAAGTGVKATSQSELTLWWELAGMVCSFSLRKCHNCASKE
jgi:hypothetical protein